MESEHGSAVMMKRTRLSESNGDVAELFGSYGWEVAVLRSESGITLEYQNLHTV